MIFPVINNTARDVTTGILFLAYSSELSLTYAQLFAERIAEHLKVHQVRLNDVTVQTDNGSEFVGSWQAVSSPFYTCHRSFSKTSSMLNLIPLRVGTMSGSFP